MALDVPLNCAFFRLLHLTPTHRCRPGLHWPALLHPGKGKQSRGVSHDTTLRLSPTLGKVSHPLLPPLTLGLPAFKTTNFSALSAISTSAPGQTSRDRSQSLHAASRTDPSLIPKSISTMAGRPRRGAPHTCSWRLGLGTSSFHKHSYLSLRTGAHTSLRSVLRSPRPSTPSAAQRKLRNFLPFMQVSTSSIPYNCVAPSTPTA